MKLSVQNRLASQTPSLNGRLGQYGVNTPAYDKGQHIYLNWAKAHQWRLKRGGTDVNHSEAATLIDPATGEFKTDGTFPSNITLLLVLALELNAASGRHNYADEHMVLRWQGNPSTVSFSSGVKSGTLSLDMTNKVATFQMDTSGQLLVQFGLSSGAGSYTSPPRAIEVYQDRYSTERAAGWRVSPWYVEKFKNAKIVRFMDALQTNFSSVVNYSQLTPVNRYTWAGSVRPGFEPWDCQGIPLAIICEFAQRSGADVWFNIPRGFTDSATASAAAFFRDNMPAGRKLYVEYDNEIWNFDLSYYQTNFLPAFSASNPYPAGYFAPNELDAAGYRAAQLLNIFRTTYGESAGNRWEGVMAPQTGYGDAFFSHYFIRPLMKFCGEQSPPLHLNELVSAYATNIYWGTTGFPPLGGISAITRGADTTVTTTDDISGTWPFIGLAVGDPVRIQVPTGQGCQSLRNVTHVVKSRPTSTSFTVEADTTGDTNLSSTSEVVWCRAEMWQILAESQSRHASDPTTYPTDRTYLHQVLREGITETGEFPSSRPGGIWNMDPAGNFSGALTILDQFLVHDYYHRGLAMDVLNAKWIAYEGGCHFLPARTTENQPDVDLFLRTLMLEFGNSQEHAEGIFAKWQLIKRAGMGIPAQYTFDGLRTQYGLWASHEEAPQEQLPDGDQGPVAKLLDGMMRADVTSDLVLPTKAFAIGGSSNSGVYGGYNVGRRVWPGAWSYAAWPPVAITYQWQRDSNGTGSTWSDITGATTVYYDLVSADIGKKVRCKVLQNGSLAHTTAASPVIAA